jgi:cell wall-associated NlpC family hydrolase
MLGMAAWYNVNGFVQVETLQVGDSLVYENGLPSLGNHVGVYLGENKILHHIPNKLSSIDLLDNTKILGIFRYGSNS